jgi:hypothetical protein
VERYFVPTRITLTAPEREKLGVLINNIGVYASQLMHQDMPGLATRALANLAKFKAENEDLVKRLDELARELGDASPLRLVEDLARTPADVAQMLTLVRRCALASAFLGHCIAQASDGPHLAVVSDRTAVH